CCLCSRRMVGSTMSMSFFFQAEDGIRAFHVTGVQTCALPISSYTYRPASVNTLLSLREKFHLLNTENRCCKVTSVKLSPFLSIEIGRASCRERGMISAEGGPVVKKKEVEEVRD